MQAIIQGMEVTTSGAEQKCAKIKNFISAPAKPIHGGLFARVENMMCLDVASVRSC